MAAPRSLGYALCGAEIARYLVQQIDFRAFSTLLLCLLRPLERVFGNSSQFTGGIECALRRSGVCPAAGAC